MRGEEIHNFLLLKRIYLRMKNESVEEEKKPMTAIEKNISKNSTTHTHNEKIVNVRVLFLHFLFSSLKNRFK